MTKKIGYHITEITPGIFGEASKIREELDEFEDALEQGCKVMALVELSDMIGAIRAYLIQNHPSIGIHDLIDMSHITERAFANGNRKSKE